MLGKFLSPLRYLYYQPLEPSFVLADNEEGQEHQLKIPNRSRFRRCFRDGWIKWALVFFIHSTVFLLFAYVFKVPSDTDCARITSIWCMCSNLVPRISPSRGFGLTDSGKAPAHVAVEYKEMDFDNDFAHDTIYRGPPSPALEGAWDKLWRYGSVRIPEKRVADLNRTVDLGDGKSLRPINDDEGGYSAMIEVFHQLHCLNMIRQYTWHDWYLRHTDVVETPEDMKLGDVGRRMHVDHCIEALRVSLMCQADTTPLFIIKDPESSLGERADFSSHHKCRNFEKIRRWNEENQSG